MTNNFKELLKTKGNDEFDAAIYDDYYIAHKSSSDRLIKKKYGSSIYGIIINNKGYKQLKGNKMFYDPVYINNKLIADALAREFAGKLLWFKNGEGSFYANFENPTVQFDEYDYSNGKLVDVNHPYFRHRKSFDELTLRNIENNQYTSKIKPDIKAADFVVDRGRMTINSKKLGFHFNNVLIKIVNKLKAGKSSVGNFTLDFGKVKFISYTYEQKRNDLIISTIVAPDYIDAVKNGYYELDIICEDVL